MRRRRRSWGGRGGGATDLRGHAGERSQRLAQQPAEGRPAEARVEHVAPRVQPQRRRAGGRPEAAHLLRQPREGRPLLLRGGAARRGLGRRRPRPRRRRDARGRRRGRERGAGGGRSVGAVLRAPEHEQRIVEVVPGRLGRARREVRQPRPRRHAQRQRAHRRRDEAAHVLLEGGLAAAPEGGVEDVAVPLLAQLDHAAPQAGRQAQRTPRGSVRSDLARDALVHHRAVREHRRDEEHAVGPQPLHRRPEQAQRVVAAVEHVEQRHGAEALASTELLEARHRAEAPLGGELAADLPGRLHDGHARCRHSERRRERRRRFAAARADVE